jgi:N-acetylglucosaminyldiphosphoundecaprenol N-acetyl-beta-D-mannosaminyltransferase
VTPQAQVLSYPVSIQPAQALLKSCLDRLQAGQHTHIVTLNPEMIMRGESDRAFSSSLKEADVVLPDGAGVVWALNRCHIEVKRLPGIEFSEMLLEQVNQQGGTVALIGATPEVLEKTQANLSKRFPFIQWGYTHHGYFEEAEAIATACAASLPTLVLVALGVPAQEQWITRYKSHFNQAAIFVGVGGSFDVWSGLKRRAPKWMCALHLEWLYRITSEPWRIKRVYKPLPGFVFKVLTTEHS